MNPWEVLGRERAPDGGELVLSRRGDEFMIRVGRYELMSRLKVRLAERDIDLSLAVEQAIADWIEKEHPAP